jgi:hypothetical protein
MFLVIRSTYFIIHEQQLFPPNYVDFLQIVFSSTIVVLVLSKLGEAVGEGKWINVWFANILRYGISGIEEAYWRGASKEPRKRELV